MFRKLVRTRVVKLLVIVGLISLAFYLKGEKVTCSILAARLVDLFCEIGMEGVRKNN